MNIWKSLLAVCLLIAMFGCGASASKKANQEGAAKQLPRLCVTGTQLMNEQGDTVVLKGVSYGWHQFWPRFYRRLSFWRLGCGGASSFYGSGLG